MDPLIIRLGTLRLAGTKVEFEPAPRSHALATPGQPIRLVLEYDYEEPSNDKDTTRVVLRAQRGREQMGEAAIVIEDTRIADDSQRSHVALDAAPRERGRIAGRFDVTIRYQKSAWGSAAAETHDFAHGGSFDLEIA